MIDDPGMIDLPSGKRMATQNTSGAKRVAALELWAIGEALGFDAPGARRRIAKTRE